MVPAAPPVNHPQPRILTHLCRHIDRPSPPGPASRAFPQPCLQIFSPLPLPSQAKAVMSGAIIALGITRGSEQDREPSDTALPPVLPSSGRF